MKRKNSCLVPYTDGSIIDGCGEPEILDPIKLSQEDIDKRTIELCGFKFLDTGYALACPQCGKISGLTCREDIDRHFDVFLKFGCEHYTKSNEDQQSQ